MRRHPVLVVLLSLVAAFVLWRRTAYATCGDGILDPGEDCDPGPDVAGDCCTGTCSTVACPAADDCHDAGTCDPATGLCSNPSRPDGTSCNTIGTCSGGRCATPIALRHARVRSALSETHRGHIVVQGRFVTVPPDALGAKSGLAVRITDAANLDVTISWTAEECRTGPGIRGALCVTRPARKAQLPAYPDHYGVKLRLLGLDIHDPYQPPVTVTIMQDGGVDRVGTISACSFPPRGGLECLEHIGP